MTVLFTPYSTLEQGRICDYNPFFEISLVEDRQLRQLNPCLNDAALNEGYE
jgi:hypothetical protein